MNEEDNSVKSLQHSAAELLATVRDVCKTSQKAVDSLVAGVDRLFEIFLDVIKVHIKSHCSNQEGYLSMFQINAAIDTLKGQSVFEGIETKNRMESFLSVHSGGEKVLLKQVGLEWKTIAVRGIPKRVPTKAGYVVPFLAQLEQLLNLPDVLKCVENPLPRVPGHYKTVLDGLFYAHHPVVQEHGPQTLAISIHVDDVDPCDALKSKANKHNQRLFYWVLNNINPKLRSTLKAINLLAIVKAKIAKEFGNEPFLQDFVDGMKMLGTEGVDFNINGTVRRMFGVLLFAAADNPASANLGKFKETFSAIRPCRVCMVKSECLCQTFIEEVDLLRKINEHNIHVKQVEAFEKNKKKGTNLVEVSNIYEEDLQELLETEEDMDWDATSGIYHDNTKPSVNFGVNGRSILSSVPGFDVTKCLPQDIMHLLAEGVVELVCRLVLKEVCFPPHPKGKRVKPLLGLGLANEIIQTVCEYGHVTVSKPSLIEPSHVKGKKLRQSASQMLVLLFILPFLIFKVYPEKKFLVVIKLIKLVDLCMQYKINNNDIAVMRNTIEDFGNSFVEVFPNVKTLKLHCLVHLPMQSRLFGPPRQHACFRFEAMHNKFTSLATVIRNMKNYALSVAVRHLASRNFEIMKGKQDGKYLYGGDKFIHPEAVSLEVLPEKDLLLENFPNLTETSVITRVKEFSQHSSKWHEGVAFLLDQESKSFGRISSIYLLEKDIVFIYHKYITKFVWQFNAFEISKCEKQCHAVSFSALKHQFPILRLSFNFKDGAVAYLLLRNATESF